MESAWGGIIDFGLQFLGNMMQKMFDSAIEFFTTPSSENVLTSAAPEIDWVAKGVISSVKNQDVCDACYAFSSLDAIEAYYKIKKKKNIDLSV